MIDFHQIETERLILRKIQGSDWERVSYLRTDPKINQFVKRTSASTKTEAIDFIQKIQSDSKEGKIIFWCITERSEDIMIGSICLWNFSDSRKKAELGYDLDTVFQGKGIMNEALNHVLDFGFNHLELNFIDAYTQSNNESSRKLLERNGFRLNSSKKDDDNELNVIYELQK